MTSEAVDVPRYWAPVGHDASFDGGFLRDPATPWLRDDDVKTTEELAEEQFVVLLGEQGMGKSHVLLQASCPLRGDLPPAELGTYSSDDRLERRVLEAPWIEPWRAGQGTRTLVLDGLDEAQLYIPTVDDLLAEVLSQWPLERLRLRIACRGHSWSSSLQTRLGDAYGSALGVDDYQPMVVNLLPLRRVDAAAIATSLGVSASAFMDEVDRADVGSLAGRPLTLRMLVERFRDEGSLDGGQADLYRSGMRALVDEQNSRRGRSATSTADQVMAVCTRVAAAWLFGGHATIRLGGSDDQALRIEDLVGGREGRGAAEIAVDLPALRAVLASGLVRAAGEEELTWAHATFADHLAARWVVDNDLSDTQVRSLLLAPDGHVWPQTRLAAGWCIAIDPSRYAWLAHADPVAFIGDVDLPGDDLRATVVEAIFSRHAELTSRGWIKLDGLEHQGLADQVRSRLRDDDESVRRVALELARDCDLPALRDALIDIALDDDVEPSERTRACWALVGWGERQVPELRPLVTDSAANAATDDDLLGLGLRACWPETMTTSDVLRVVREPRRRNYHGSYAGFLGDLAKGVSDADLPAVVAWLHTLGSGDVSHHLEPLADAALEMALRHLDNPFVAHVVADRLLGRLAKYLPFGFSDDAEPVISVGARHTLVGKVLGRNPSEEVLRSLVAPHRSPMLGRADLPWVVDQVASSMGHRRRQMEIMLESLFSIADPDHVALALALPDGHPAEPLLMGWFTPQAFALRLQWDQRNRARDQDPTDDLNDELDGLLDRFDAGDDAGFWRAIQLLSCHVGTDWTDEVLADVTSAGRWATLTQAQQVRVLDAGLVYLERAACEPDRWLGENVLFHPARAAYRALVLMRTQRPSDLKLVSDRAWREWAPVLVDWTTTINGALWEDKEPILDQALVAARAQLVDALVQTFEGAADRGDIVYASHELSKLMDRELATRLSDLLGHGSTALSIEIAKEVAGYNFDLVRPALLNWLDSPSPQLALAEHALGALWDRDPGRSWRAVADRLDECDELAAQVVGRSWVDQKGWKSLPAGMRADIYLWMLERFPRTGDPAAEGAHWVGPREEAAHRRDGLFGELVREGTHESVAAVRRVLASGTPGVPGRWVLAEAESHLRRATWLPLPFSSLRELAERASTRLVRSSEDLLGVMEEALGAIQNRLIGPTPESHLLWNTDSMTPKGEDEMSDYLANRLKDHLEGRGVVINREVQVRRAKPTVRPRQVDIQIDATGDDAISLPIEVKGSWHKEVESGLSDQLADQYMADLGPHGVYVVMFPDLESWAGAGSRRALARRRDRTKLVEKLESDAAELVGRGLDVRVVGLDVSYAPPGPRGAGWVATGP